MASAQNAPVADAARMAAPCGAPAGTATHAKPAGAAVPAGMPAGVSADPAKLAELGLRLRGLAVFRNLLSDHVVQALLCYIDVVGVSGSPTNARVGAYGDLVAKVYAAGCGDGEPAGGESGPAGGEPAGGLAAGAATGTPLGWGPYLQKVVFEDRNVYTRCLELGQQPDPVLASTVSAELETLQMAANLVTADFLVGLPAEVRGASWLPLFPTQRVFLAVTYMARARAGRA